MDGRRVEAPGQKLIAVGGNGKRPHGATVSRHVGMRGCDGKDGPQRGGHLRAQR